MNNFDVIGRLKMPLRISQRHFICTKALYVALHICQCRTSFSNVFDAANSNQAIVATKTAGYYSFDEQVKPK